MTDRQDQRAGDSSHNIQAGGNVTIAGISYTEARAIAEDVFRSNFLDMRGLARETAEQRAQQILDEFIDKMRSEQADPSAAVSDPDMQFAVLDAQTAYARSGEAELAHVLTDILMRRSKEPDRTTLQLVLNESLRVAPKLNVHQFDLLTVSWLMRYVKIERANKDELFDVWARSLEPFVRDLRAVDSSYSHLQYAGCGAVEMGAVTITQIILQIHPTIFLTNQMDPKIEEAFRQNPILNKVADYWYSSQGAKHFTLTSVGIAIANAHFVAKFPDANVPLGTWIQ